MFATDLRNLRGANRGGGKPSSGGSSPPPFTPASLSLTGWWKASFTGSPWVGAASAGASGSRDLVELVVPPTAGTAVNGLTPADFNGTDQKMANVTLNNVFFGSELSAFFLINARTTAAAANGYDDGNILTDAINAETTFGIVDGGITATVYSSGFKTVTVACATGAWKLAQFRLGGGNLSARVNGGSWTDVACGAPSFLAPGLIHIGRAYAGGKYFDGNILEIGLADSAFLDADFDNIRTYILNTYGLTV